MKTASLMAPNTMRNGHLVVGMVLTTWFVLVTLLSVNGVFVPQPGEPPLNLLLSFAVSVGVFAVLYVAIPAVREYVLALDMRMLILLHTWRMLGLGFVMLYVVDQLPLSFAFLAGFGDVMAAIGAMALGYLMFTRAKSVSQKWIWRWNTFGILDFVAAIGVGLLTRQGALLEASSGLNSDLMLQFPLVIIPAFLVQVLTITHIIIYLQLRRCGVEAGSNV